MPLIPPPPPSPIEAQPGHFPWTDWMTSGLVSIVKVPIMADGLVTITPVANTPTSVAVSFPVGRFTVPPAVIIGADATGTGTTFLACSVSGVTATGFLAWIYRTVLFPTPCWWQAYEMTG